MNIRRAVPASLLAAATASTLLLTGCGKDDKASASSGDGGGKVDVVAAFYSLKFLAQQIGGPQVKVTSLTKPGAEPHDLELKPRQVASISDADLVVYLKGLQPAVDKAIAQNHHNGTVEATRFSPLEDHGLEVDGTHDHAHGAGDGHDHASKAGGDPHIWLDPTRMAAIADGVGEGLAKADPAHAEDYRNRTAELKAEFEALDNDFKAGLATCRRKEFVTSHAAFGYLAERYGLDQIGVNGVNPESEPSPARIAELQKLVRDKGVTTVFFETLASPKTAQTLARDTGATTAVLDPLEGVEDEAKDDYFSVMHANLDALRKALGCA
ncbi:metal ABC transporter substrate-binding protein [Yinghuangia seranimata]|uniref:metal ABC transporter substrate-binding protein n=1 Tax=Yinghuangia seranimata TaxID=408067 RepID=UPI00248B5B19|nr:metal ABC transporter substrate-binding protein [Yinghuangia seranimata]MDI2127492.1 metal ABC transporter substrate-binding protein [Yinghuangia seranimata]